MPDDLRLQRLPESDTMSIHFGTCPLCFAESPEPCFLGLFAYHLLFFAPHLSRPRHELAELTSSGKLEDIDP